MEKPVTIIQQFPLQERQYTDRNGQQQIFASRGFVLSDGIDTFFAEATGDMARNMPEYTINSLYNLQAQITLREYKGNDGQKRYANEVRIIKLA